MRLLEHQSDGGFRLTKNILDQDISQYPYAILSHRWGNEEVTFEDVEGGLGQVKTGYRKIEFCGNQAAKDGLKYFWVDSCCIKKTSDAELSSSINSMCRWYRRAAKCYVYLTDISTNKRKRGDNDGPRTWERAFRESKWFTRGWTLQELLAPASVEFFSSDGERLGDKETLRSLIHEITGISLVALEGRHWHTFSIFERRSWAKNRVTTIEEDEAYCLLGLFDISMSTRYGEGKEKAFERLNSKIKKATTTAIANESAIGKGNTGKDELDAILRWLSSPDPSTNYETALKLRQVGTGSWFLQHKSYIEWKAGRSHFLWLYGIPGCGKSILSSTILEDLLRLVNQSDGSIVVYFYFDFKDPQKRKADLMVWSILRQLVRCCPEIPAAIANLFSSCDGGNRKPPLSACVDALRQTIAEMSRVFLVIDALDECEKRNELMDIISLMSGWEAPNLHVLLTSRKERDIEDTIVQVVSSGNMVSLQSDRVDLDIRAYVITRLSEDASLGKWRKDDKIQKEIESVLTRKAQGMFRWAVCQLDALAKCRNRAQLRKSLSTLPPTLDKTYERILCAIPEEDAEYALRILRWLAFAERPLLFEEIAEIAAFNPERETPFDENEVLEDSFEVLDICSSLVITTTASGNGSHEETYGQSNEESFDQHGTTQQVIVLAHYSVKEYLTSQRCINGQASQYAMDEAVCHMLISESCLSSLLVSYSKENRKDTGNLALNDYSAHFWIRHAQKGQKYDRWTRRAVLFCSNSSVLIPWIRIYDLSERWDSEGARPLPESLPQGLYYASSSGFIDTAAQLIEIYYQDVNAVGGFYGNALQAASSQGHEAVVELLLSKGADINAQGGSYGNALQAASTGGHQAIFELLLRKGADANAQGGFYGNALQAAAHRGHKQLIEILLNLRIDINTQGGRHGNALQAALHGGHKAIVELLLNKGANINGNALQAASSSGHMELIEKLLSLGADVNAQGGWDGSALQIASEKGHERVVRLLISKGADVNAQSRGMYGNVYGNALQAASHNGHQATVELLLSKGADISAQGGHYGDVLSAAVHGGHKKLVEMLLSLGVDVNCQGGGLYGTPLRAACYAGHEDIVNLLISKGANVNVEGEDQGNALQAAADGGHTRIIEMLLSLGVDVNSQDGYNGSALQTASGNGHKGLVELLISRGANVNAQGGMCGNALQIASSAGHEAVVELLLSKGADINAQGGHYGNALQAALSSGYIEIVELLFSNGADANAQGGFYGNELQAAAYGGQERLVEMLLDLGLDINAQGGRFGSALQAASYRGRKRVIELLLSRGADVNAQGGRYGSALEAASRKGDKVVVQMLIDAGAINV